MNMILLIKGQTWRVQRASYRLLVDPSNRLGDDLIRHNRLRLRRLFSSLSWINTSSARPSPFLCTLGIQNSRRHIKMTSERLSGETGEEEGRRESKHAAVFSGLKFTRSRWENEKVWGPTEREEEQRIIKHLFFLSGAPDKCENQWETAENKSVIKNFDIYVAPHFNINSL